ncbi:hypothetical protein ACFLZB_04610, partial [Nanoarchaeota archaeon]
SIRPKSSSEDDLMKEIQEIEKALAEDDDTDTTDLSEETDDEEETDSEDVETDKTDTDDEEDLGLIEDVDTSSLQRLEVDETDLVSLELDVSDADEDQVTYTFSKPLDENGQWQTNYGDAGEYIVTVTASDGLAKSEKKVLLLVNKKNVPPVIEGLESELVVDEGDLVSLEPRITDPNRDEIEVTFSEPLDDLGMWFTDHTSAGQYEILVTASDGEMQSQETVELTVIDVNVPPTIDLGGIDDVLVVNEGETVNINPVVTDLDNDAVEVTISEPIGNDGVWEIGYTDNGEYEITIIADDGKDTTTKEITLIVEDVNLPPEIIDITLG